MANRWGKNGNSERLYFGGSKITADGDCSHEIKRSLCLGRKTMTNLDSIFKSRDITLPTKVCLVKPMIFPVVMYGCESWTIKKTDCWRIDAFELWCWRRLLRVPWTARRSNQSTLKEISPEYSFEGLMLKLKLQYFGHLMRRADSLEKTLMLGKPPIFWGFFSNESALRITWPKYWSFSFNISPSNEHAGWTGWISLQAKGLSRVFSNTTVQKHQFCAQLSSLSNSHSHTWLLEKPYPWLDGTLLTK